MSEVLHDIADDHSRERIYVRDLLGAMQDRSMATLMFVFAAPNILPVPPGTSSVLGTPLILLSMQLMFGIRPWLPDVITARSLARRDFASVVARAVPWLVRAEAVLRPRLEFLAHPSVQRLIGAVCFALAVLLVLPIPFGNLLPALAICVFSLGLLAHDGLWILAGVVTAVVAIAVGSGVVFALVESAIFVLNRLLG